MDQTKIIMFALLALALLSSSLVVARPRGDSDADADRTGLREIASELTRTLNEVVEMLQADRVRSRRRRMVQFHIGRIHHTPRNRFRRGRRYRKQRGGRIQDISDH